MKLCKLFLFALLACSVTSGLAKTYSLMDKITTQCELEALSVGTRLADHYNSFDEDTEWDTRVHNDYLVEHLGFAGWIQLGLYKNTRLTAERQNAPAIHQVPELSNPICSFFMLSLLRFALLEGRLGR